MKGEARVCRRARPLMYACPTSEERSLQSSMSGTPIHNPDPTADWQPLTTMSEVRRSLRGARFSQRRFDLIQAKFDA